MTRPSLEAALVDAVPIAPVLDIAVPVFNEEAELEASVRRLHTYLADSLPYTARITIVDNASTDGTVLIAHRLAAELDGVQVVHLNQKGRGHALSTVWTASDAAVLAYMDVDLATDLTALLPLVAPLISGHSDVAIGSRLTRSARVVRGPKRELISRSYNLLLHGALATRFFDAQCGFKAIRAEVAEALLPLVQDTGWFFDTELLVLAERSGCASTRCRWTGSTTPTVGWTCCPPRSPICAVWREWAEPCSPVRYPSRPSGAAWGGGRSHLPLLVYPVRWCASCCVSASSVWRAPWPMPACTWRRRRSSERRSPTCARCWSRPC